MTGKQKKHVNCGDAGSSLVQQQYCNARPDPGNRNKTFKKILIIYLLLVSLLGCVSVPKEVVELSYTLGQDIASVQASYKRLIRLHFDSLRKQMVTFLENRWVPCFIKNFVEKGGLAELVKKGSKQGFQEIQAWALAAVEKIQQKKNELLEPINKDERNLLNLVDEAFDRIINTNTTITAHLNSIRKVKTLQDDILGKMGLKELRDKINQGLVSASEKANKFLEKLQRVNNFIGTIKQ
ncbi:MAG: hypothetical protein PVH61_29940 [Candidatus Aminicenantes bacterium]|jgi:hypothetical protein